MSKKKIYYKVVQFGNAFYGLNSNKLYSANYSFIINKWNTKMACEYSIDDWTFPHYKNTDLMVFDSLENAKKFISSFVRHPGQPFVKVYTCEIINPRQNGLFINVADFMIDRSYDRFIKLIKNRVNKKKFSHLTDKPPVGTVFCSGVKLLEEIKN